MRIFMDNGVTHLFKRFGKWAESSIKSVLLVFPKKSI